MLAHHQRTPAAILHSLPRFDSRRFATSGESRTRSTCGIGLSLSPWVDQLRQQAEKALAVLVTLAFSSASYRLIEQPIRHSKTLQRKRFRSLVAATITLVIAAPAARVTALAADRQPVNVRLPSGTVVNIRTVMVDGSAMRDNGKTCDIDQFEVQHPTCVFE